LDRLADLVISGSAGEVLPLTMERVKAFDSA
jgi:hypothetical protein